MDLTPTAARAIEAYGGAERWQSAQAVEARGTLTGWLFRLKWRKPQPNMRIRCEVHRPWTRMEPIDPAGHVGILDGQDVRLEAARRETVRERRAARSFFSDRRRLLYWDTLDLTYFLGYALWNYFALPALLLREDIVWTELREGVLASEFPSHLPTHGRHQRHTFDTQTGLLIRYDYVPEVFSKHAIAANVVIERGMFEGVPYEPWRLVTPARELGGKPMRWPVMVDMRFWDWRLL